MFVQFLRRSALPILMSLALAACAAQQKAKAKVDYDARPVVDYSKEKLPTATNAKLPTLYVVGDSTARSSDPMRGWGSELGGFFDPAKINVVNRARGGRSSRTFMSEGLWDAVLKQLKPGDFVLIQFGHNDAGNYLDPRSKGRPSLKGDGEETAQAFKADWTTQETIHTFGWYMRKYASEAKAKGATPIILSMVPHKDWKDGKIVRKERDAFVKWDVNAAKATGALFIDANEIISEGLERVGAEKVNASFFADARTHSTPEGAKYNAAAVVLGMKSLKHHPFNKYFSPAANDLPPTLIMPKSSADASSSPWWK